ncbi:MAG: hypothetical protein AB8B97_01260 [Granulosicoccus sp.]
MTRNSTSPDYAQLFNLPETHTLRLSSVHREEKNSTLCETRWLAEHDDKQKLIARFRTWTNRSLTPPYRRQLGWERFSLSGNLLDREVRYSKRDNQEYLH